MKPRIAITMGDPAGIGPEIIVKALAEDEVARLCQPLVIGHPGRLRQAAAIVGSPTPIREIACVAQIDPQADVIWCLAACDVPADLPWGRVSASAGEAAFRCLETAARLAMKGDVDAICTAPLSKEALFAAGHPFPGHTEALAALTGTPEVSMMLMTDDLRVIHVTTHIGLIDAIERIEPGLVARTVRRGVEALRRGGIARPRVGVCGINPHAGEGGLFGRGEEASKIVPAIEALRQEGHDIEGPLPADTLFFRARRGDFDLVVAMYHDQGHGPVKVLGIEAGVNVTVGLPVIRTSVDHGTAFDIAGTGKADPRSLVVAIEQAERLSRG
jgi:4-hydroxythreonine-4-phosphate dehydrogenase